MGTKQTCLKNMKDSGVYYIGSVPDGYEITRYKYLSDVKMGNTILESETSTDVDNEYKIAVYSATQSDKIFGYVKEAQDILKKGDIVIPARGNSIGCAKLVTKDNSTSTQTTIMSYNIRNVNNKYLFYCSWAFKDEWYRYDGSAIPQITVRQVENNMLPLPNALLQDKIVSELDKKVNIIDELIKNQEQQIEKLKEYKQSLITEVVTKGLDKNAEMKDSGVEWIGKIPKHFIMQRMKRIGNCRNGLTYSPDEMCGSNGVLVLRSSNIQNGRLVFEDNVYVNKTVKDDLIVKIGDILICSRNGSRNLIGKNAIIESDLKCSFGAFMMIFRSNYNSKYIYYILNSSIFNYYLGTYLTSTINQLTGSNFENMIIPFTNDKKEQKKIVNFLDNKSRIIEETINIKYKKIEKLNEYKKSLIYEYVTGKKEV